MNPRILSRVQEYVLESSSWNELLMWVFRNDGRSSTEKYSAQSPAPCRYLTFVYVNLLRSTTKLLSFDFFTFLTHEGNTLKRCSQRLSKFVFTISTISRTELIRTSIRIGVIMGPFISISSLFGSGCRYTIMEPAQS